MAEHVMVNIVDDEIERICTLDNGDDNFWQHLSVQEYIEIGKFPFKASNLHLAPMSLEGLQ